jgi:hypothetical protein
MSRISIRVGAIAVAAVVALTCPQGALARGGGGGGGGGGGHFGGGGGGGHFGGGGAFHMGGGGGGFHPGGGGFHSFAPSFARPAFARPGFSRPAFSGGAFRSFARPGFSAATMHTFSHPGFGIRHVGSFARPMLHAGGARLHTAAHGFPQGRTRSAGMWNAGAHLHGVARTTGAMATGALAAHALRGDSHLATGSAWSHGQWAHHDWGWHNHADWRKHRGFFGWFGPVFWPWFFDDLYSDLFWDYGPYYENPFWSYGYGDIYGALFSPYGYGELADWAPAPVAYAPSGPQSSSSVPQSKARPAPRWSSACGDDTREVVNLPIDRISAAVSPDDQQRAALDALAQASAQAAQVIKAACPADVAHTPSARLDAMERRVEAMVQAVALIRPPLETFYGLLSDEQKARFNAIGQENRTPRNGSTPAQACGGSILLPEWPQAEIERRLRPTEGQRLLVDRLRDASQEASASLTAACPTEAPASPPARLAAVANRLDTLLAAIRSVHAALNDLYGALTDEQKAQFNGISPVVQVRAPKQ